MHKFGTISEVDEQKGLFKVKFDDQDIVSGWLPGICRNTLSNQDESWFDVNEHVVCLMDENLEHGVILGSFYSKNEKPVVKNKDIRSITFSDGSFIKFDRSAKKLTVSCEGDVEVIKSKNVNVTADTKIKLTAPNIEIDGKLKVTDDSTFDTKITATGDIKSTTGGITAQVGDVKAGVLGISLELHTHTEIIGGSPVGTTGPPLP